jgi:general stress protein 26
MDATMEHSTLLAFIRAHRWAIEATSSPQGTPQSAIIGVAARNNLELIFDGLASSRKVANLRSNPQIALVIGGWRDDNPRTLQYEGVADFPEGAELERVREDYIAAFPDGKARASWAGITYVRVRPSWLRFSDFSVEPPFIVERVLIEPCSSLREDDA